jgi:hypothetical protein
MAKTTGKQRDKLPGGITGKGFLPGQCGNPSGRPRTAKFSEIAREVLAEEDPKKRQTVAERLVRAAVTRALAGSTRHLELLLSYTEGRPKQHFDLSGSVTNPLASLSDEELNLKLQKSLEDLGLSLSKTE